MRAKFMMVILLLLSVLMVFVMCKKDEEEDPGNTPTPPAEMTEQEKQQITASYTTISGIADVLLLGDDPIADFTANLNTFKNEAMVADAWVTEDALFVEFTKGNVVSWYVTPDFITPPYIGGNKDFESRVPVGNTSALLINQVYTDERFTSCLGVINHTNQAFTDNGFTTTVINGPAADLDFFKNGLDGYGAVFNISHGTYDGTRTWLYTGEPEVQNGTFIQSLLNEFLLWWQEGKISVGTIKEKHGGTYVYVKYYKISDKFILDQYSSGSFPNSLVYLVACKSFMGTTQMAQAFNSKGAGAILGWDQSNSIGHTTGQLFFDYMLGGDRVEDAFNALPAEAKKCPYIGANLSYYPASGKDIVLVEAKDAEIIITNPVDGQTYTERVQTLEGYVENMAVISSGTVEINGIATTLTYSGTYFAQSILINNGNNSIKVNAVGVNEFGETVHAEKLINVNGDIAPLDIFTELRWNTDNSDVDFHLLPPGADMSALWTYDDCYYSNMAPSWGGFLDVDDVDGYGPEHITVPAVTLNGTYRLFIHNYANHGAVGTLASVDVSSGNGAVHSFGPYALNGDGGDNAGDVWEVCTITFPGGTITPVNQFYNLGFAKSNQFLPKK